MPSINVRITEQADQGSGDGRHRATAAYPVTYFPGNVDTYEIETFEPYSDGIPIGGYTNLNGREGHKPFLSFGGIKIPKGSVIDSAVITVNAKSLFPPDPFLGTKQTINISAIQGTDTLATGQQSYYGTEGYTLPGREPKGTFTVVNADTTYIEKKVDVRALVQELVNQFDFDRDGLSFRMTNKTWTQAYTTLAKYPRATPTFTAASGKTIAQIYQSEQGSDKQAKLDIVYRTSQEAAVSFGDNLNYKDNLFSQNISARGFDDPALFGNQAQADTKYFSADTANIAINPPFPNSRLDINAPPSTTHNSSAWGGFSGTNPQVLGDRIWYYRFKINIAAFTVNTDATPQAIFIGLSDSGNTETSNIAQDFIGLKIETVSSGATFQLVASKAGAPDSPGAVEGTFTTPVATGEYFVEVVRAGNNPATGLSDIRCTLYADKDHQDRIETVTGVTTSTITGLDRPKFMSQNLTGTGNGELAVEWGWRTSGVAREITGFTLLFSGSSTGTGFDGRAIDEEPSTEPTTLEDDIRYFGSQEDIFIGDNWSDTGIGFGVDTVAQDNNWTADNSGTHNLTQLGFGILSDSKWLCRFELDIENLANGADAANNGVFMGMMSNGATATTWSTASSYDSLGLVIFINNSIATFNLSQSQQASNTIDTGAKVAFITAVPAVGKFFIEMIKTTTTSFTVNIYSDSNYSILIESQTATISNPQSMRSFKMLSRNNAGTADSTLNGNIDNFQLLNAATTYPSPLWNQTGTRVVANRNTAHNQIEIDATKDSTIQGISRDVYLNDESAIKDEWELRFSFEILTSDTPTTNDSTFQVGLSSVDDSIGVLGAQDSIIFEYNSQGNTGVKRILLRWSDGVGIFPGTGSAFVVVTGAPDAGDGKFWISLRRVSATQAIITLYSDPDFTNSIGTSGLTTIPSTLSFGIGNFIKVQTRDEVTSAGILTATVDDVEFWDGKQALEFPNKWKVIG